MIEFKTLDEQCATDAAEYAAAGPVFPLGDFLSIQGL